MNYYGKHVLVTGDTGFVGTWLTTWLRKLGADVVGLSLPEDVGNPVTAKMFMDAQPDIVFHLAAQALVAESIADPLWTFKTNVMGTTNVLDAVRQTPSVKATVVITSDKCYAPTEGIHSESDQLGGDDPYSASKACAELVAQAYRKTYDMHIATARAGNIIGGGDWSNGRIVPDCIRALQNGTTVQLRNPDAVRPFQHVLDAVHGYLMLGEALLHDPVLINGAWNFGPKDETTVAELVTALGVPWECTGSTFLEQPTLRLNSRKAYTLLGWEPLLRFDETVNWTYAHYCSGVGIDVQIKEYEERLSV